MGTEISLDVAGLTVDWSKNQLGADHGFLFQSEDRRRVAPEDEDCGGEHHEPLQEMAFIRPLSKVLPRLELLGHTLATARFEYDGAAAASVEERRRLQAAMTRQGLSLEVMSFDEFRNFVARDAIADLDDNYSGDLSEEGKWRMKGRFADRSLAGRVPFFDFEVDGYSERSYFG